ncbi:MAG: hypothetical protein V4550_17130 [Gemmatimonadota bacterium]
MTNSPWAEPQGAYAILALLSLGVLGATLAPGGWRDRRRRAARIVASSVLVGVALSLVWPRLTVPAVAELDASTLPAERIAGVWRDGVDTLRLAQQGTFECRGVKCSGFGARGTWSRESDGTLLVRWSDGHTVPWRIVEYHGRLRLGLKPPPHAGAAWEGHLSFERVEP